MSYHVPVLLSAKPPISNTPQWSIDTDSNHSFLRLQGDWILAHNPTISFDPTTLSSIPHGQTLKIDASHLKTWDSALIAFLWSVEQAATKIGLQLDIGDLPPPAVRLMALLPATPPPHARHIVKRVHFFEKVGELTLLCLNETGIFAQMIFDATVGALHVISGRSFMRKKDLFTDIWNAGPSALLIVGVVNFLLGSILAFVGLIELRKFSAEIYVTSLVGIACAREISAIMTAIIMAGRTGGAYAARISTMQGNEEIDALTVFGIPLASYILLPSIISLSLMMPFLYIYGTLIGIFGGFVVSMTMMDISPIGYWISTFDGVALREFIFGFVKSYFFAVFIATASCRVGLQAGRSAADVGIAATRAVVISIVGIIAMDAVFAVIANALRI